MPLMAADARSVIPRAFVWRGRPARAERIVPPRSRRGREGGLLPRRTESTKNNPIPPSASRTGAMWRGGDDATSAPILPSQSRAPSSRARWSARSFVAGDDERARLHRSLRPSRRSNGSVNKTADSRRHDRENFATHELKISTEIRASQHTVIATIARRAPLRIGDSLREWGARTSTSPSRSLGICLRRALPPEPLHTPFVPLVLVLVLTPRRRGSACRR